MRDNFLKYIGLTSFTLLVLTISWLFFNYLKVFSLFPVISILALISYTIFIVRLYLNNVQESKLSWMHWIGVTIILLPVFMGCVQFFDTSFYENYWPVIIILVTLQSVIGLMGSFGFFITRKNTPSYVKSVVFCTGIYAVAWSFLVLSKSVVNEAKLISLFVLIALSLIIVIGNILLHRRKDN